jgi:uncharacterized membrane protein
MQNMSSDKSSLGLDANVVAGLCYVGNLVCALGLILSIITVITEKTNKLARFHAFQSILITVTTIVLVIIYWIAAFICILIDNAVVGFPLFTFLLMGIMILIFLGLFIGMVFAAIKAFQGQIFKLPIIGKFADQFSN